MERGPGESPGLLAFGRGFAAHTESVDRDSVAAGPGETARYESPLYDVSAFGTLEIS